jgi:hypothetical protein
MRHRPDVVGIFDPDDRFHKKSPRIIPPEKNEAPGAAAPEPISAMAGIDPYWARVSAGCCSSHRQPTPASLPRSGRSNWSFSNPPQRSTDARRTSGDLETLGEN